MSAESTFLKSLIYDQIITSFYVKILSFHFCNFPNPFKSSGNLLEKHFFFAQEKT